MHISDLHIGLRLINRDLADDQRYILNKIADSVKAEAPDALVIAGDIYDKAVPSAEAVELFNRFIATLSDVASKTKIMIISGNHDSALRIDLYRNILKDKNIYMIGTPPVKEDEYIEKITLTDEFGKVNFYLLPFVKPSVVKGITGTDENGNNLSYNDAVHYLIERENINTNERNVIVSHQFYLPGSANADDITRADSEIISIGNIDRVDSEILSSFDYAALGHIHKPMLSGSMHHRYCGTPLACSVSEAGQKKGILLVEMNKKGDTTVTTIPLVPLREVKKIKGEYREVLKMGCNDYVSVVLTDKSDLDVIDMQDRLRMAFPNLLEIQREHIRSADIHSKVNEQKLMNPFELCCAFLGDTSEEEQALLKDVINTLTEVEPR